MDMWQWVVGGGGDGGSSGLKVMVEVILWWKFLAGDDVGDDGGK